jgi:hypothetical protein
MKLSDMALAGILGVLMAQRLSAKDLFVPPAPIDSPRLDETWPVTPAGVARFAFGVPDDMSAFESATVVLLPAATASGTYSLKLMIKRDSELSSAFDIVEQANLPLAVNDNQVTEVDVSSIFSGVFDGSSAGNDYVSLIVQASSSVNQAARVLGLRFVYETGPLPGSALADNSVGSVKILNDSILSADIRNESITGFDVRNESLDSADIKNGSVAAIDLAVGAVTGDKILAGAINALHLADEAGVDYAGGSQTQTLVAPIAMSVRSLIVEAPVPGHVLLSATGSVSLSGNEAEVACGLRPDAVPNLPSGPVIVKLPPSRSTVTWTFPFATTKGFAVGAGTTTFHLFCSLRSLPTTTGRILNSHMTAIFSPTRY